MSSARAISPCICGAECLPTSSESFRVLFLFSPVTGTFHVYGPSVIRQTRKGNQDVSKDIEASERILMALSAERRRGWSKASEKITTFKIEASKGIPSLAGIEGSEMNLESKVEAPPPKRGGGMSKISKKVGRRTSQTRKDPRSRSAPAP